MGNSGCIQKYAVQAWLQLPVQLNKIYKFTAGSKQLRFFFFRIIEILRRKSRKTVNISHYLHGNCLARDD
jgi:hypothetical protein